MFDDLYSIITFMAKMTTNVVVYDKLISTVINYNIISMMISMSLLDMIQ